MHVSGWWPQNRHFETRLLTRTRFIMKTVTSLHISKQMCRPPARLWLLFVPIHVPKARARVHMVWCANDAYRACARVEYAKQKLWETIADAITWGYKRWRTCTFQNKCARPPTWLLVSHTEIHWLPRKCYVHLICMNTCSLVADLSVEFYRSVWNSEVLARY